MKAKYTSVWDGGINITTNCDYDPQTKKVSNIESVDPGNVQDLDDEFITLPDDTEVRDFILEDE